MLIDSQSLEGRMRGKTIFLVLLINTWCSAAPRVFVDSRPTVSGETGGNDGGLILRELPRQALIIHLTQDLGASCIDASIEPDAKPQSGDIRIGLDRIADINTKK